MQDNKSSTNQASRDSHELVIPGFRGLPALKLDMVNIKEAEMRYIDAKNVNPITYVDLEHCFNESYRDIKRHLSNIEAQLRMADKVFEEIKADILLGSYAEFMKDKTKSQDNADLRKAFMYKNKDYSESLDRINQLKAIQSFMEGKLKVTENVCRYMRKHMDLIMHSGMSNRDLYTTIGRK